MATKGSVWRVGNLSDLRPVMSALESTTANTLVAAIVSGDGNRDPALAGASPYDSDDGGQRLLTAVSAIQADYISGVNSNVRHDSERTIPHSILDRPGYIRLRLEDQTSWYEGKASFYNKRAWHWRLVSLLLGLVGTALSGIAAAEKELTYLGAWVGVIGTLGGIVVAQ